MLRGMWFEQAVLDVSWVAGLHKNRGAVLQPPEDDDQQCDLAAYLHGGEYERSASMWTGTSLVYVMQYVV